MKDNNDPIKQENKKAMHKFALVFILSMAAGLVLGVVTAILEFESFGELLEAFWHFFAARLAGWLLCACPVVELAAGLPLYFSAKRQFAAWDGEDEAVSEAIERRLSVCIWITSMATILGFFLLPGHLAGMIHGRFLSRPVHTFWGLGAFLVNLMVTMLFQQKLVDATKRLNPEKRGSVYDTKFHEKWLDSCDEAERAVIGQCAMKAFRAVTYTCLVLWVVFILGGIYFEWGLLPAMAVCIIWGVSQSVYSYWALKLSKPGGRV